MILQSFVRRFFKCCSATAFAGLILLTAMPLWAQEVPAGQAEQEPQIWVLPYAIMLLFFGLALAVLLRPLKRSDSAFSSDEQLAHKEEEMKKMKGGH